MTTSEIAILDNLSSSVAQWRELEPNELLSIGDRLNTVEDKSPMIIGAWLHVYSNMAPHGGIKTLAERWDRSPRTLYQWKNTAKQCENLYHDEIFMALPYGKMQVMAAIPDEYKKGWLLTASKLKRSELQAAVKVARASGDW